MNFVYTFLLFSNNTIVLLYCYLVLLDTPFGIPFLPIWGSVSSRLG